MKTGPTILFAGGGTGGHLFPGIAVADELQRRDPQTRIVFIGSSRSIESTIVAEHGLEHRILPVEPLTMLRRNPLRFVYRNWQAIRMASQLVRELNPSAVIGLGGYASAPLAFVASRRRIPVILTEQNVIPGRTTRWISRFATNVCISFPDTNSRLPRARQITLTGNPVRSEIASLVDLNPDLNEASSSNCPVLLILGGSQGADSLNVAVLAAVHAHAAELAGWKIVHQTGPRNVDDVRKAYSEWGVPAEVESFFNDMSARYRDASLVISRSGATTLAELACAGHASILLPYPHAADDHQKANARVFVDHQAAVLVEHAESPEKTAIALEKELVCLLKDVERRRQMGRAAKSLARPNAARNIADVIELAMAGDPHGVTL
jgi:UDP-N-acetylglucosamine--N-acetylmuramyl-(pentapeptide) pyrophosphoryl-undecaprenol N-acetylglucosamine transferase